MHLSKDEQILYNHFEDMYDIAYNRGAPIYSDFMGLNNVELAYMLLENKGIPKNLYDKKICIYGGYDGAIYQMLCFLPESYYIDIKQSDFPISCVKISPVNKKFCDKLTHRDFLKLISSITQIKHTTVKTEIISNAEISIEQKFKEISGSVASLRLDSIISVACKSSRSQCLTYIKAGNVYINGRCCTENAKEIKNNDIITIRGFGKFLIETSEVTTKKGRFHIIVKQYV